MEPQESNQGQKEIELSCPVCLSKNVVKNGHDGPYQRILCKECRRSRIIRGNRIMNNSSSPGIITLEKIQNRYDIKTAILRELEKIERGTLILEAELCQRAAGFDKNRFRRAVENNEELFKSRRVKLRLDDGDPKWYWGWPEDIAEAIRMRDL